MAQENPSVDSRDALGDSGVRPGMSMGSPTGKGGRFESDLKPLQELDTALTKLNTNINRLKTDLPKVITLTEQWAAKMQKVANAMNGMNGGGGAPTVVVKDTCLMQAPLHSKTLVVAVLVG